MNDFRNDLGAASCEVVVVIPTHRLILKPDEELSLGTCRRVLGKYPTVILTGDNHSAKDCRQLTERYPGVTLKQIDHRCFASEDSYNRLLLSSAFYELFREYRYMLIHQLDVLVFKDELSAWCERGYHYIGAPMANDYDPNGLFVVGNGGFSLRHVAKFIEVTTSRRFIPRPIAELPVKVGLRYVGLLGAMRLLRGLPLRRCYRAWFVWAYANLGRYVHEDGFYSWFAQNFTDEFRKPSPGEALQFAIEREPEKMLRLSGVSVPFGCHDFGRYDRDFVLHMARENNLLS